MVCETQAGGGKHSHHTLDSSRSLAEIELPRLWMHRHTCHPLAAPSNYPSIATFLALPVPLAQGVARVVDTNMCQTSIKAKRKWSPNLASFSCQQRWLRTIARKPVPVKLKREPSVEVVRASTGRLPAASASCSASTTASGRNAYMFVFPSVSPKM